MATKRKHNPPSWQIFLDLIRFKNLMMIALVQMLIYFWLMTRISQNIEITLALDMKNFFLLMYSTILMAAFGNTINDVYDLDTDHINKIDKVIVGKYISKQKAIVWSAIMLFSSLVLALWVCIRTQSYSYFYIFPTIGLLLWAYAAKLKGTPLLGNIVVSLLTAFSIGIIGLFDYILQIPENQSILHPVWVAIGAYVCFAFLLNMIRELIKDMQDKAGDVASGLHTFPVLAGITTSKVVVGIISLVSIALLALCANTLLTEYKTLAIYLIIAVLAPMVAFLIRLFNTSNFGYLSRFAKFIMLLGVLSILFI